MPFHPVGKEGDFMINRTTAPPVTAVILGALLATVLGHAPIVRAEGEGPLHLVSGTLLKLDLDSGRGLLRTDLGRPIYFDVPKAYLFENVTVGARIALRLDDQGRALKVMDTSLPDFVAQPDQSVAVTAPDATE
jgi:hypothetical protein